MSTGPGDHRKASFVGLLVSDVASRPYNQVIGAYLSLLVASRTSSALAITFALTAHRYFSFWMYPVAGRLSDRTTNRFGRRVPYMVVSSAVMAAAMWLLTVVGGYWPLVLCIVVAREGDVFNGLTRFGVVPDVFGRSRWASAIVTLASSAFVPGLLVLGFIKATWDQDDPSSWNLTFRLASVGLAVASISVALLVRESAASRTAAAVAARRSWREELSELLGRPNARPLLITAACLAASGAATGRLFAVWANRQLGAGGGDIATASIASGIGAMVVLPIGLWLAGRAHPRHLAVAGCVVGVIGTLAHVLVTDLWMTVVAGIVMTPLAVAGIVSLVPSILRLMPRADNLGEGAGFLIGPTFLATMTASYLSALVVDVFDDYRLIWVCSAMFLAIAGVALSRVRLVPAEERTDVKKLWNDLMNLIAGDGTPGRRLFGGKVEEADVLGGVRATVDGKVNNDVEESDDGRDDDARDDHEGRGADGDDQEDDGGGRAAGVTPPA